MKIFIIPVENVIHVRTGEGGKEILWSPTHPFFSGMQYELHQLYLMVFKS